MKILDPSSHQIDTPSVNLGDLIIRDSVHKLLSSRIDLEWVAYNHKFAANETSFIGGANILGPPERNLLKIWRPSLFNLIRGNLNFISLGCGWWSYEASPYSLSARYMKRYLSIRHPHSVRDQYSADMLNRAGFQDVYVTGCPSMYGHKEIITDISGKSPVITVTFYRPNIARDRYWLDALRAKYKKIYFFVQGPNDLYYLNRLTDRGSSGDDFSLVSTYDDLLTLISNDPNIFHVGTRLHANMLFLRNGLPSICLDVDSRTAEIKKTFQYLPIYSLNEFVEKVRCSNYIYTPDKSFDSHFDAYLEYLMYSVSQ